MLITISSKKEVKKQVREVKKAKEKEVMLVFYDANYKKKVEKR